MPEPVTAERFVEDRAHEDFLLPLVSRIACEAHLAVTPRVRSARGGHARVMQEFRLYQNLFDAMIPSAADSDLVIVAVDCNGESFAKKRAQIRAAASPNLADRLVLACPAPYIPLYRASVYGGSNVFRKSYRSATATGNVQTVTAELQAALGRRRPRGRSFRYLGRH